VCLIRWLATHLLPPSAVPLQGLFPAYDENNPTSAYTNAQLEALLDPTGNYNPYIYDDLTNWGGEFFDPFDRTSSSGL
jgi:hypothetical protein